MHKTGNRSKAAHSSDQDDVKVEWKVENTVATAVFDISANGKIDLNSIVRKFGDCEYNPERFPGLIMRVADPKATILLFSTGKAVITGLRTVDDIHGVLVQVVSKVKNAGVKIPDEDPITTVQNIVASGDLHKNIDLNEAALVLDNAMYEPEVFPGMIYRMEDPKCVFLLFSTGKVVCTGAKKKEFVGIAVEKIFGILKENGLFGDFEKGANYNEDTMDNAGNLI